MLGWVWAAVGRRPALGIRPELLESEVEGPELFVATMLVLCQLQGPQFPSSLLRAGTKDRSLGDRRLS